MLLWLCSRLLKSSHGSKNKQIRTKPLRVTKPRTGYRKGTKMEHWHEHKNSLTGVMICLERRVGKNCLAIIRRPISNAPARRMKCLTFYILLQSKIYGAQTLDIRSKTWTNTAQGWHRNLEEPQNHQTIINMCPGNRRKTPKTTRTVSEPAQNPPRA